MTAARAIWCGFITFSICFLVSNKLAIVAPFLIPLFWLGKPRARNETAERLEAIENNLFDLKTKLTESKNDAK